MCLQGLDQSGQVQLVFRSPAVVGKRLSRQSANASSMSVGISPASSLARNTARPTRVASTRAQSFAGRAFSRIETA